MLVSYVKCNLIVPRNLALLVGLSLWFTACGGSQKLVVTPQAMPAGGSFSGVWHSPQYGEMHLLQDGVTVRGRYEKDERTGRINGEAQGDLLRFEWVEKRSMIANLPKETRGKGFFRYRVDPGNGDHVLQGRWWLGDDTRNSGVWNAYKMQRRQPQVDGASGVTSSPAPAAGGIESNAPF